MSKDLLIIFGNGFTIDLLHHLSTVDETKEAVKNIDVRNLFRFGSCVPWPTDGTPGFLSFKNCPNLWHLGARPGMSDAEAMALIENVITCINTLTLFDPKTLLTLPQTRPGDIYIHAYKELTIYLKHLFVHYDNKLRFQRDHIEEWPWSKFLESCNKSSEYRKVTIVTYNYDVWLERLLKEMGIAFNIGVLETTDPNKKFTILKPHGSISFAHRTTMLPGSPRIIYDRDFSSVAAREFQVRYDQMDEHYLKIALIPPAGDTGRLQQDWSGEIHNEAKTIAEQLSQNDELIICGISYWYVDRTELDSVMTNCGPLINIKMINPSPSQSLDAVLSSVFSNYISYNSSAILEDLI